MPVPEPGAFGPDASIAGLIPLSSHVSHCMVKTTDWDFPMVSRLDDPRSVGREECDPEPRHGTFSLLLQTLRAPDFVNVAFWVHDLRRRGAVEAQGRFGPRFNQALSDQY